MGRNFALGFKSIDRTCLVVQWLRICLPMQGTRVWSLVQEDSACHRATKPVYHNSCAQVLQLLKPAPPRACARKSRSHGPCRTTREQPSSLQLEKASTQQKDPGQPRINKLKMFNKVGPREVGLALPKERAGEMQAPVPSCSHRLRARAEPEGVQALLVFWTSFWSVASTKRLLRFPTNLESSPCRELGLG